jgi:hypothetical protein
VPYLSSKSSLTAADSHKKTEKMAVSEVRVGI